MKRFVSDSHRRSVDSRLSKIVSTRRVNNMRLSRSVLKERAEPPKETYALDADGARYIYSHKCEELEVVPNPLAEERFIGQFRGALQKKSLMFGKFSLGPNAMTALLNCIFEQKRYVYADFSLNRIGDVGAKQLALYLECDPPIIHMDLRSNGIHGQGFHEIFKKLKMNTHLVSLDVSAIDGIERNIIASQGCRKLAQLLLVNEHISHLNVSVSGIPPSGCLMIGGAMSHNKSLIVLDISGNRFGTEGANNLFRFAGSFGVIEALYLSRNNIGDKASVAICRHIENTPTLKILDLAGNCLSKVFVRKLLLCLQRGSSLENLSLAANKLGPDVEDSLSLMLKDVPSLKVLNLAENQLKDVILADLAKAMLTNVSITWLDLSDTFMGDASAVKFAEVIERNIHLKQLRLDNNHISDVSGTSIAIAIAKNVSLTTLSMRHNEMKDGCARAMMDSLQKNETIMNIDVNYNDFSYSKHAQLTQAIADHKKYLSANFGMIASRHIEELEVDEQRLGEVRQQVKEQTKVLCDNRVDRAEKTRLFTELKETREREIAEAEETLERLTQTHAEVSEERRQQLLKFEKLKRQTEHAESEALSEFQTFSTKRQHASARFKRSENKKLDAEVQINKVLDDLKVHLLTIKDQLRQMLREAHMAQDDLLKREADELEEANARKLALELLNAQEHAKGQKRALATVQDRRDAKKAVGQRKPPAGAPAPAGRSTGASVISAKLDVDKKET